jgi:hypothetical protein
MRKYIDIVEQQHKAALMESLLLEYQDYGRNRLAPAFAALYEVQMSKRDATDRILAQLLQKHGNNVQAVVDAVKAHKTSTPAPSASVDPVATPPADMDMPSDASQKSAVATLKHALTELPKLAQRADDLVPDPSQFIRYKTSQLKSALDAKIDASSKFKPLVPKLKKAIDFIAEWSKKHPRKTSIIVAGLGVGMGLLTGGPWAAGAFTAIIKLILMVIQGRPFGEAVKEVLKSASIGLLLGFGITSAIAGIESLLNSAQAASTAATDAASTAADAVSTFPSLGHPWLDRLQQIYGEIIPQYSSDGESTREIRNALGPGKLFFYVDSNGEWQLYSTSTGPNNFPPEVQQHLDSDWGNAGDTPLGGANTPEQLAAQLSAERLARGAADVATSTANAQAATDAVAGAAAAGDTVGRAADAAGRAADAMAGVTNADIPTAPVVDNSYLGRLRQLVDPTGEGTGIPTMNQSKFGAAFRAAREAMGPGNVFVWNGNAYTTNIKAEGLLNGLSDEVKTFLRGRR